MKVRKANIKILLLLLAVSLLALDCPALAQSITPSKQVDARQMDLTTMITYHGGWIMTFTPDVFFIWYGCWEDNCGQAGDSNTQLILTDFIQNIGGTPYFQMNAFYYDYQGHTPSGALLYGGSIVDRYSHGTDLNASDIQEIVADAITDNRLPQDPGGIYVVLASADVSSLSTGFCVPSTQPHHGQGEALGSSFRYAFVGNPMRCPRVAAPQYFALRQILPTPNGSLAADGMASTLAHVLSTTITNPVGEGWYDGLGLQNADKCEGQFGPTYETANGARANLQLGQRNYLIQQNWANDGEGRCAMSQFQ
jgi:hypothetical protein